MVSTYMDNNRMAMPVNVPKVNSEHSPCMHAPLPPPAPRPHPPSKSPHTAHPSPAPAVAIAVVPPPRIVTPHVLPHAAGRPPPIQLPHAHRP